MLWQSYSLTPGAGFALVALLLAGHAQAGRGNRVQAFWVDLIAAALTYTVGAFVYALQRFIEVLEALSQALCQGKDLGSLGGRLCGVGETFVEMHVDFAVRSEAQVGQLRSNYVLFVLQPLLSRLQVVLRQTHVASFGESRLEAGRETGDVHGAQMARRSNAGWRTRQHQMTNGINAALGITKLDI